MFNISGFFLGRQGKYSKELSIRTVICEAIKNNASFDVAVESISFNSSTAIIGGMSAMQQSQLYIKKQAILFEIDSKQSLRKITDIK